MNVLYIITDMNIGGTEKMLYETATRINRERHKPVVCCLKGSDGIYLKKLQENNIKTIALNIYRCYGLFFPITLGYAYLKLVWLMKKEKIDIVHTYLFQANILGGIAAKMACVSVVISSIRGKETDGQFLWEKWITSSNNKIMVNSDALKELVLKKMKISEEKINVVYNAIDLSNLPVIDKVKKLAEFDLKHDSRVIGTVGRLHREKGIGNLINALALVAEKYPDIKCLVVGDGPHKKEFGGLVKKLKLTNNVVFTGSRTDSLEIISVLDIFVLASPYEGMPNVLLEAVACGIPVVATGVGGVKDLITDKENGMLVEPGDPESLSEAIIYMVENEDERMEMSKKAKEKVVKNYSMNRMIDSIENMYEILLKEKEYSNNGT